MKKKQNCRERSCSRLCSRKAARWPCQGTRFCTSSPFLAKEFSFSFCDYHQEKGCLHTPAVLFPLQKQPITRYLSCRHFPTRIMVFLISMSTPLKKLLGTHAKLSGSAMRSNSNTSQPKTILKRISLSFYEWSIWISVWCRWVFIYFMFRLLGF